MSTAAQDIDLEAWIAARAADYPEHRKYLEAAEEIHGAVRVLEHLTEQGVVLCRPVIAPLGPLPYSPENGFWWDAGLYDGACVSGKPILAAFGICYDCLMAEKRAMVAEAEAAARTTP